MIPIPVGTCLQDDSLIHPICLRREPDTGNRPMKGSCARSRKTATRHENGGQSQGEIKMKFMSHLFSAAGAKHRTIDSAQTPRQYEEYCRSVTGSISFSNWRVCRFRLQARWSRVWFGRA